jgi:glyoxylase-like metal-dependent hydrolase (beta-lactamase superfamily II)
MALLRDGPYQVVHFAVGPYDNNIYLLSDPKSRESVLIDAANNAARILKEAEGLRVTDILTTHGHGDHVQALAEVQARWHARARFHAGDAQMMPVGSDRLLQDGDRIMFGAFALNTLHTPGHTPGSVCFLIDDLCFSGDTLFPGGPGATRNRNASFPQIIESIRTKLFTLPNETQVLPGHGASTTIARERPHLEEWIARGW